MTGASRRVPADEAAIRERIRELVDAVQTMDVDRLKAIYGPDIVSFDVGPALQSLGAAAKWKNWEEAFTLLQSPLEYEVRDLTITMDGNLAFTHSFNRLTGTFKNGERTGFWVRATCCFRKTEGRWLMVHDHVSVPLDFESGRALLNLEP